MKVNTRSLTDSGFSSTELAQRSTLSPILFNVYTLLMYDCIMDEINLIQYAHNLILFCFRDNMENLAFLTNSQLGLIDDWVSSHDMRVSTNKSQAMFTDSRRKVNMRNHQVSLSSNNGCHYLH